MERPLRERLETLWRLDATMGKVLVTGREPLISRIRLAWWREALEALDTAPPPPEPMLRAAASHLLTAGLTGHQLAELEGSWAVLSTPEPLQSEELFDYSRRGEMLFRLTHSLLGGGIDEGMISQAGRVWALVDFARRSSTAGEIDAALALARADRIELVWPRPLRPLGMLYSLAAQDAERQRALPRAGSPGRLLRMMIHRVTGR